MSTFPLASVVIPTHNRLGAVRRTIDSLTRQTCGPERYEIVVAANACTDGTLDWLRGLDLPCMLRVIDLPAPGAAAARNAGAGAARGAVLIFVDDDVTVAPEFVAAHLAAHGVDGTSATGSLPLRAAIGYLPAALQPDGDFFAIALRGWWEAMFDRMREPGHRFAYTDLLTGNFSMPREHFARLGGFDERYRCHEDYELGYRLIQAGAAFVFVQGAWGLHADHTRLDRACWRKREEGRADVQLGIQHPALRSGLLMTRRQSRKQRLLRSLAFHAPWVGDRLAAGLGRVLPALEAAGARASWRRVLYGIFGYWYERGLADAAGTPAALRRLAPGDAAGGNAGLDLDVSDLDLAEHRLDTKRPDAATLRMGSRVFARVAPQPGSERLAGRHLRPTLAGQVHWAYVRALIDAGRIPPLAPDGTDRPHTGARLAPAEPAMLFPEPAPPHPGR